MSAGVFMITNDEKRKKAAFRIMEKKNLTMGQFFHWRCSILQRRLVEYTPPRGPHPGDESWADQKQRGQKTEKRDLRRTFTAIDKMALYLNPTPKDVHPSSSLRNLVNKGDLDGIRTLFTRLGIPYKNILAAPSKAIHELARNARGSVDKRQGWFVLHDADLNKLEKELLEDVGKAKAGWISARNELAPKIPGWVLRHAGLGAVTADFKGPRFWCKFKNNSPATQGMQADEIVAAAIEIEGRSLVKEANAMFKVKKIV